MSGRELRGTGALVTGGTSGLGRAVANRLAAAGADVAIVGRSLPDLGDAAREVGAHGVRVVQVQADLAHTSTLHRLVDEAAAELGGLGILVNAAATDRPGAVEEVTVAEWEEVVAVNLTAPFALARAALPHLRRNGRGVIVNVSSVAGRRGWAGAAAYCSTKFALTGLTQALAAEVRRDGIRVCVLYPGAMATSWGDFTAGERGEPPARSAEEAMDPAVVADLVAWMATAPGDPVLNEVTITPLLESGWP